MTKVQIDFQLQHALDDELMTRHRARPIRFTGFRRSSWRRREDSLTVEYDATRLRPAEVHAALTRAGIPVVTKIINRRIREPFLGTAPGPPVRATSTAIIDCKASASLDRLTI